MLRFTLYTLIISLLIISPFACKGKGEVDVEELDTAEDGDITVIEEEPGDADTEEIESELTGEWKGKEKGEANIKYDWEFVFDGENFTSKSTLGEYYRGTVVLNDGVKPHQIDMVIEECVDEKYAGTTALGIYKYEDGTLKIALNEPGDDTRPDSFSTSKGARLWELKKEK